MTCSALRSLQGAMDEFAAGGCDIAALQENLSGNASALSGEFGHLVHELRLVDADLERIQFAMIREEQRAAAILRLDPARQLVLEALEHCVDDD